MRTAIAALVVLVLAFVARAGGEKDFADPAPRADAILKRFDDEFVTLTPGEGKYPAKFIMGSDKEGPAHPVTLRGPFAVARYEVTQELYRVVMGDNPSRWKGPRNSVEMVDYDQASTFCARVTTELRKRGLLGGGERIRLPSEAEWEYACRAGSTSAYAFGDDVAALTHYAWYRDNSKGYDPPVGQKQPNAWGLYDMHGYVAEWCRDAWHKDYTGAPTDGAPWDDADAKERVLRGGAWSESADAARSAARARAPADTRSAAIGLRCVKELMRTEK